MTFDRNLTLKGKSMANYKKSLI